MSDFWLAGANGLKIHDPISIYSWCYNVKMRHRHNLCCYGDKEASHILLPYKLHVWSDPLWHVKRLWGDHIPLWLPFCQEWLLWPQIEEILTNFPLLESAQSNLSKDPPQHFIANESTREHRHRINAFLVSRFSFRKWFSFSFKKTVVLNPVYSISEARQKRSIRPIEIERQTYLIQHTSPIWGV